MWVTDRGAMLLKKKSLFLFFVAHGIICAVGYVVEDGKSPPKTLELWLPTKNFGRLQGPSQWGFIGQRAQSRNSNAHIRQQARPTYFDSHFSMQARAATRDPPLFRQAEGRQHAMNLPHQALGTYQDSTLFQQVEGRNFVPPFRNWQQSRTPFEQHEIIDTRSPISKPEREQHLFWRNNDENHGSDLESELNSASFGGGGFRNNLYQGYQRQSFHGEDMGGLARQANRAQRGRDHFFMRQNPVHVNHHEFDDTGPVFFVGESDYSHEITHEGNEEEICYKSPFTDHGASNDQIDEDYDFFSNQDASKDNAQYYFSELEDDQKTSNIYHADFEVDFSNEANFFVEKKRVKVTPQRPGEIKPTQSSLDSFEVGFKNSFTNESNLVRSLEALESQQYNNKKIRGKDKGGIYPVISSVQNNVEDIETSGRKEKNLQVSPQLTINRKSFETTESKEEEPPSSKQNRIGHVVGLSGGLHDSKNSNQIENNQDEGKETARHIQSRHVPGYTTHRPKHVHLSNGVPTNFPNVYKEKTIVITNPPELHQTIEVHHQLVPQHPGESIVSIQSLPEAFVEVPEYVPGVQKLDHFIDQHQQQQYLEVNFPKHVKVHKIRKGYIYELHLSAADHLHQKENTYDHYPPGHHERLI